MLSKEEQKKELEILKEAADQMCVTDNSSELNLLFESINKHSTVLFDSNYERIKAGIPGNLSEEKTDFSFIDNMDSYEYKGFFRYLSDHKTPLFILCVIFVISLILRWWPLAAAGIGGLALAVVIPPIYCNFKAKHKGRWE